MKDWLLNNIEEGIRTEVSLLRQNGFNTESSCEHEMSIQCQYLIDGAIKRLHDLLFNNDYKDYEIIVLHNVKDGFSYTTMTVHFAKGENGCLREAQ